jgi:hypothetical protein
MFKIRGARSAQRRGRRARSARKSPVERVQMDGKRSLGVGGSGSAYLLTLNAVSESTIECPLPTVRRRA